MVNALDCKSSYSGSIPLLASKKDYLYCNKNTRSFSLKSRNQAPMLFFRGYSSVVEWMLCKH